MDNSNEVRTGFRYQDVQYLKRYDNATAAPDIQLFTAEEDNDEEPEVRKYFCAVCKSRLDYLKDTETIWRCNECMQYYDTKIQDVPIANNNKFRITPHYEINRYPKFDDEDINIPFVKAIDLDDQQDSNIEILRQSADGRIQHTRIVDNSTKKEAIRRTSSYSHSHNSHSHNSKIQAVSQKCQNYRGSSNVGYYYEKRQNLCEKNIWILHNV